MHNPNPNPNPKPLKGTLFMIHQQVADELVCRSEERHCAGPPVIQQHNSVYSLGAHVWQQVRCWPAHAAGATAATILVDNIFAIIDPYALPLLHLVLCVFVCPPPLCCQVQLLLPL